MPVLASGFLFMLIHLSVGVCSCQYNCLWVSVPASTIVCGCLFLPVQLSVCVCSCQYNCLWVFVPANTIVYGCLFLPVQLSICVCSCQCNCQWVSVPAESQLPVHADDHFLWDRVGAVLVHRQGAAGPRIHGGHALAGSGWGWGDPHPQEEHHAGHWRGGDDCLSLPFT